MFEDRADVFVAGDLFCYAVKGLPDGRMAPDVMLALGRLSGHRGSYEQWQQDDVPVTVAFEILSPRNDTNEMARSYDFHDDYRVEE